MNAAFLNLPGFRVLAVSTCALFLKMTFVGFYTASRRAKAGVALNKEDLKPKHQLAEIEIPVVARGLRAHRNDVENIPMFLILALLASMSEVAALPLNILIIIFTVLRFSHTYFYLREFQPWRTVTFASGMLTTLTLIGFLIYRVLSSF